MVLAIGPEGGWSPHDLALLGAAGFAGVRLGPVLSIVEDPGLGHERYSQAVDMSFSHGGAHMPIQAGTDTVTARFTITFRIERDLTA